MLLFLLFLSIVLQVLVDRARLECQSYRLTCEDAPSIGETAAWDACFVDLARMPVDIKKCYCGGKGASDNNHGSGWLPTQDRSYHYKESRE